eukprot:g9831.t1
MPRNQANALALSRRGNLTSVIRENKSEVTRGYESQRGVSVLKLVHFTSVSSSSHSPEFTPSQGLDKVVVRHGAPFSPLLVRPGGLAGHIDCLFDYGAVRPGLNPLVIIA